MNIKGEDSGKVHFREIFLNIFHQKRFFIILFIIVILVIAVLIIYFCLLQKPVCGDGTDYDECSNRKPYFCSNGTLIEKASICGCFENLTINGDSCFSQHQTKPKNITLNYVLKGEEGNITFVVYDGLADYLSKISRSLPNINGESPTKADFKFKKINDEEQRYLLLPLVTKIQNLVDDEKNQLRIAVSLLQEIPFGSSEKILRIGGNELNYARYPYEVLNDEQGICSEKAELLVFILREMGYGTAFFYYPFENHEVVALECPKRHSVERTGYCFIEPTGPSIITDDENEYIGGKLSLNPELIIISDGKSIGNWWYEYEDARILKKIRNSMEKKGMINALQYNKFERLRKKYGLTDL
jgi:hypothetical protein